MKKLILAFVAVATVITGAQATKYKTCESDIDCGAGQVCRTETVKGIGVRDRVQRVCTPADAQILPGAEFPPAEYVRDLA